MFSELANVMEFGFYNTNAVQIYTAPIKIACESEALLGNEP